MSRQTSAPPSDFPPLARSLNIAVAGQLPGDGRMEDCAGYDRLSQVLHQLALVCQDRESANRLFGDALYQENEDCLLRVILGANAASDGWIRARAEELGYRPDCVTVGDLSGIDDAHAVKLSYGVPHAASAQSAAVEDMRDMFALAHADLLVVIWDGTSADKQALRIASLVHKGLQNVMPMLWIDLEGHVHSLDPKKINESALQDLAHRVLNKSLLLDEHPVFSAAGEFAVSDFLQWWIDPLKATRAAAQNGEAGKLREESPEGQLRKYVEESDPPYIVKRTAGLFDGLMAGLFSLSRKEVLKDPTEPYLGFLNERSLPESFIARFAWSDVRANIAAGRHRSGVWMMYLLSALAVLAAVIGAIPTHEGGNAHEALSPWAVLEIVCLAGILILLTWHREKRWHARWLGHRFMAEQLRYLVMTRPFMALPHCFFQPLVEVEKGSEQYRLRSAEAWLLRRTIATEGISGFGLYSPYSYMLCSYDALADQLGKVINDQIGYHCGNKEKIRNRHRAMHWCVLSAFVLAILVVAAHFCPPVHHIRLFEFALVGTAAGPALAAALHGILTKLEYARIGEASAETERQLQVLKDAIELRRNRDADGEDMLVLRAHALDAARAMSMENEQWRLLVSEQKADIPA